MLYEIIETTKPKPKQYSIHTRISKSYFIFKPLWVYFEQQKTVVNEPEIYRNIYSHADIAILVYKKSFEMFVKAH